MNEPKQTGVEYSQPKKLAVAKLLQKYRCQAGLTQTDLAHLIGLKSLRMIQYWEAGDVLPKTAKLKKLIQVFTTYGLFKAESEHEEIDQLWSAVAEAFSLTESTAYPELDKGWLEDLLVSQLFPTRSLATTLNQPSLPLTNVPASASSFIGRQSQITRLANLLAASQTRLLTLVGPGGIGKTRLALEVVRHLQTTIFLQYPDGIWLIDLVGISEQYSVLQVMATVLHLEKQAEADLLPSLLHFLQEKRLLLILDNCEHIIEICAELVEKFLSRCPNLQILATSRESLNLVSEFSWTVASLELPPYPFDADEQLAALENYEAAQLFLTRARAIQPAFTLTNSNTTWLVRLCHLLDGIPLALELAAARIKALSVQQIVLRLQTNFQLLDGSNRTSNLRHQTIQALITWSYDLLTPSEQALLRRLSVFRGSFSLEAAEIVAISDSAQISFCSENILDLLLQLINKSLVVVGYKETKQGVVRYRLLEMIRQYGLEKLANPNTEDIYQFKWQHCNYFLALAQQAELEYKGTHQAEWLTRLEIEHDNLRAALSWLIDEEYQRTSQQSLDNTRCLLTALQLAGSLWRFWFIRGYISEGRNWLEKTLKLAAPHTNSVLVEILVARAKVLRGAGNLANLQTCYEQGLAYLEASYILYKELDYKYEAANLLNDRGIVSWNRADYPGAQHLWSESLALMREIKDATGIANQLNNLGVIAMFQGNYKTALGLYQESASIYRQKGEDYGLAQNLLNQGEIARSLGNLQQSRLLTEKSLKLFLKLGNKHGIASAWNNLSSLTLELKDYTKAKEYATKSLELFEELGYAYARGYTLHNLGGIAKANGEIEKAIQLYRQSLTSHYDVGDKKGIAESLQSLADIAQMTGHWEGFVVLTEAMQLLFEKLGSSLPPASQSEIEQAQHLACNYLGYSIFEQLKKEGQKISLEEAVNYVLSLEMTVTDKFQPEQNAIRTINNLAKTSDLTEREKEILLLVGQSYTNGQIAKKLVISPHTVNRHLTNIYSKLGLTKRTEAVRYAVQYETTKI